MSLSPVFKGASEPDGKASERLLHLLATTNASKG